MELIPFNNEPTNYPAEATAIDEKTKKFIGENRYSSNTMDSYKSDIRVFRTWAISEGITTRPTVMDIIHFFEAMGKVKKITTLNRYKVALVKAFPIIKYNEDFALFFKSLQNTNAAAAKHSKPLLADNFLKKIKGIKSDKYKFLLTLQYKGAFRISEVLNLTVKNITIEDDGLKVHLTRTKTHKEGEIIGVQNNGIDVVAMFKRHIRINKLKEDDRLFGKLERQTVNRWIKRNFGNDYSSHSLRSGHITTAIKNDRRIADVKKTSRHKSMATLIDNYYTPANIFDNTTDII